MKQVAILIGFAMLCLTVSVRDTKSANKCTYKETAMVARGTFDVKVTKQPPDDSAGGPFGRLFLEKQFHGDLKATSKGQMLAADTAIEGSGAYVAFELVTGTLNGKKGSFILQHKGTMRKGTYNLSVTVVPDSGTDELAGIDGTLKIIIEGGKHTYEFDYTLVGK